MSIPSTKTVDHIIHLTPPGTVEQVTQQFRDLGFNVIAGGVLSKGLSKNALVYLADGVFLELFSFLHPASHYPLGSPERERRDTNPWADKHFGWIDFAFLGSSAASVPHLINDRAEQEHTDIHFSDETLGGRTRADGRVMEWATSAIEDARLRGTLPFFCGDVTPREWRVPVEPPSNMVHPSGVKGVAYVRVLVEAERLARVSAQLTTVLGEPPQLDAAGLEYTWTLEVPLCTPGSQKPRLILSGPTNEAEGAHMDTKGPGIFEVGFFVGPDGVEREASTPYGKIVWLRST